MERPFRLADRCPRLALARDQRAAELARERALRLRLMRRLAKAERLVAHRDLQLARAWGKGARNGYQLKRERMLAEARAELAAVRERCRAAGVSGAIVDGPVR